MSQLALFQVTSEASSYEIAVTSEVGTALSRHCPVAAGVSGGKDSSAVAISIYEYLDAIGHSGPRLLVHCDLRKTEWAASLPVCDVVEASSSRSARFRKNHWWTGGGGDRRFGRRRQRCLHPASVSAAPSQTRLTFRLQQPLLIQ